MNNDAQGTARTNEDQYQEVSLRAVELLAKAQRAADDAVAEAQAYARDLEQSARDQYKQILQRAQTAAQEVASAEGAAGGLGHGAAEDDTVTLDAQKLTYVRTYARVAHAQLKSVLSALNDELDQLATMAEGGASGPAAPGPRAPQAGFDLTEASRGATPPEPTRPSPMEDGLDRARDNGQGRPAGGGAVTETQSSGTGSWPPIFTATHSIPYFHRGSSWTDPQS